MRYKNNNYFIENINLDKLAIKYSTPLYCYSYNKLRSNIINFFTPVSYTHLTLPTSG